MTIPTEVLTKMATLGLSEGQAIVVAEMLAAVETATAQAHEASKEKARARWRNWKANQPSTNASKRLPTVANVSKPLAGGGARVEDKTSNSEIEPQEENKKRAQDALRSEFDDEFWPLWPNKVGKPKAVAAFRTARKHTGLAAILEGVRRYVASKPPDRPWLNPATFLHQERFNDQPAVVVPMARAGPVRRPHINDLLNAKFGATNDDTRPPETALLDLSARIVG